MLTTFSGTLGGQLRQVSLYYGTTVVYAVRRWPKRFMRRIPVYRRRQCQAQAAITVCTAQWMRG